MKQRDDGVTGHSMAGGSVMGALLALISFIFLISLSGCSHHSGVVPPAGMGTPEPPVLSDEYILQPNDTLEIKFLYNPELDESVTIRPDGRISLQMVDDVRAAGLTPAQLDELLTQKYSLLVNKAMLTVMVKSFTSDRVYVGGEVKHPQVISLKGRMNALQAVFMAGGFKQDAKMTRVIILSKGPDNKPVAREVNLKKAIAGDVDFEDYRLRPFDIVYVPQTCMAGMAHFMTTLYRFIPSQVFFGFTYEVHEASADTD